MVFYAQTGYCRWRVLLEYFTETLDGDRCGACDNCRREELREREPVTPVVPLRQPRPRSRRRPFAAGDAVEVPRYGKGRVVRAVANEVTVEFAGGDDVRTFVASYVRRIVRAGREMTEVSAAAD